MNDFDSTEGYVVKYFAVPDMTKALYWKERCLYEAEYFHGKNSSQVYCRRLRLSVWHWYLSYLELKLGDADHVFETHRLLALTFGFHNKLAEYGANEQACELDSLRALHLANSSRISED